MAWWLRFSTISERPAEVANGQPFRFLSGVLKQRGALSIALRNPRRAHAKQAWFATKGTGRTGWRLQILMLEGSRQAQTERETSFILAPRTVWGDQAASAGTCLGMSIESSRGNSQSFNFSTEHDNTRSRVSTSVVKPSGGVNFLSTYYGRATPPFSSSQRSSNSDEFDDEQEWIDFRVTKGPVSQTQCPMLVLATVSASPRSLRFGREQQPFRKDASGEDGERKRWDWARCRAIGFRVPSHPKRAHAPRRQHLDGLE
ncbi:predicted protein [Coccidioides posadasii str. Silveira]|uniref:Predicted protein n=2 Tax=Coccidioides posadasii TaxID=199306 RepID=E9DHD6_COCPS|nr:predicted protein [Coccidioides posadasii str. Silveira]KMM65905.1 hypothetical protein CPAG_02246 [Coccidioides posadasii RMSCC 3488]